MRTQRCRWPVVVPMVVPALFLLLACGGGPSQPAGTVPSVSSISPASAGAGTSGLILTVMGSAFRPGASVWWNGAPLTTTYVSGSQLTASVPAANLVSPGSANVTVVNPAPGGGTSTAVVFTIGTQPAQSNHITSIDMDVAGMVWDASRGRIYAALPGTSANGNSVVAIDPVTGTTTTPVPVGSDPNLLALSSDASHLWVSLDGANAIQRLALPTLTPDLKINLPPGWHGPQIALSMQAAPVGPDTLAVLLGDYGIDSPDTGGVAIYDGTVQRPTTIPGTDPDMTWLQWGADDSTLYGQNGADSDDNFYVMNVDASGVRMGRDYGHIFGVYRGQSHYDRSTGRAYSEDGRAFEPSTGTLAGALNLQDFTERYACLPDPMEPTVFCLARDTDQFTASRGLTVRAFDKNTFRLLGNLRIPDVTGRPRNLIRWGRAGVAFNTIPVNGGDVGTLYFIDGGFINSSAEPDFTGGQALQPVPVFTAIAPESATVGSPDLVLTVSGSEFQPIATVYWNYQPLATTYHSSTELRAAVPASLLVRESSPTVYVANGTSSYAVNSMAFTVLPVSSGMIVRNLSSTDIAWDAHSSRLYAPVWSLDPRYANSVVAIDPASGSISKVAGVGADPALVRISRDGTLGYVGYAIANVATQFHVPALDSLVNWCLGTDSSLGPYKALDIQPAPDAAQTAAIILDTPDFSGADRVLTIFDNAVARPQRPPSSHPYGWLQWGLTDSVLYAAGGLQLSTIGVDATGATLLQTEYSVLPQTFARIHFDRGTGYLYANDGYVTDPATGGQVGKYNVSSFPWPGFLIPDSSLNRVFILGRSSSQYGTGEYTILSFDQAHFTPVSSLTIGNLVGDPAAFIRWGASGLAIVTYNPVAGPASGPGGMLYILDNPAFVSATQPVQPGVEKLAVGLTWQPGRSAIPPTTVIKRSTDGGATSPRPRARKETRGPVGR